MKKFFLMAFAMLMLFMISCNDSDKKTAPAEKANIDSSGNSTDSTLSSPEAMSAADKILQDLCKEIDDINVGSGNLVISEEKAQKMIGNYEKIFIRPGLSDQNLALKKSVWIESCVIKALAAKLEPKPNNVGVWVYNAVPKNSPDYNTTLVLVPSGPYPDRKHDWSDITIPDDCTYSFPIKIGDKADLIKRFNNQHRKGFNSEDYMQAKKKNLSMGMWVHKCVIMSLAKLLEDSNLKLNGVRIHSAAYDDIELKPDGKPRVSGQHTGYQSSFVLVVTKDSSGKLVDDWTIIGKFIKKHNLDPGGYNHGDLCPTTCTTK